MQYQSECLSALRISSEYTQNLLKSNFMDTSGKLFMASAENP